MRYDRAKLNMNIAKYNINSDIKVSYYLLSGI